MFHPSLMALYTPIAQGFGSAPRTPGVCVLAAQIPVAAQSTVSAAASLC